MTTIAYIRVSTDDQVDYSPDAQRSRCAQYAISHELGPVEFLSDEGLSGKNLDRPAMRQLLALVEAGQVSNVVVWRFDRLTRDTGDLNRLIRLFERHCVGLYSVNEGQARLDTAAGRMQIGIHGVFAQYYREHIVENVKMGMYQKASKGGWQNRPPSGYDLVNGELVPNEMAPLVRGIFELRAEGLSYNEIEARTGVKYSTVRSIVHNRVYLGLTRLRDEWFPGIHEPLVTQDLFDATQRGNPTGKRIGRDILSGRVRCGVCHRVLAIDNNGRGRGIWRCKHRGKGCDVPGRSSSGLHRAVGLALSVLSDDVELQDAIRQELTAYGVGATPARPARAGDIAKLHRKRKKLLDLYYADKITATMFNEEESRLTRQIETLEAEATHAAEAVRQQHALAKQFDQLADLLRDLDIDAIWNEATERERRLLVNEMVEKVIVHPDRLQVAVHGAPPINIAFSEVGLRDQGRSREAAATGTRSDVSEDRSARRRTAHWRIAQ